MVEAKTRRFAIALALMAGVALSGCEVSQDGEEFPPPTTETFTALFFSTTAAGVPYIPYPTDLFFAPTAANPNFDGTLNIPPPFDSFSAASPIGSPLGAALNLIDGYSTTAPTTTTFSLPIDGATLGATTVRVVEVNMAAPNTPSSFRRVLVQDTDYKVEVSGDVDSGGKVLKITPLKPLNYSQGANGIGYLFFVTNGVTDTSGQPAEPDQLYAAIKGAPNCDGFTNATQNAVCRIVKGQLQVAAGVFGADFPGDVVVSWGYTIQSIDDTFNVLAATVGPQPIAVQSTNLTTQAVGGFGKADIYVGTTQVPYYSKRPASVNDRSILSSFWVAGGPPPAPLVPDPNLPFNPLTRYNPIPVAQGGIVTIPVLVTVPNATANGGNGCPKPAAGWPVVIVQHGLFGDRTQALAIADSYAEACFIVAAIDMALHGVTPNRPDGSPNPLAPLFYQEANERTFNVDLVNNATNAPTPDGQIDRSGLHSFFAIIQNPLMGRDNYRQSEVDIGLFAKSLVNLDVTGDAQPDVDTSNIHFTGLSGGAIAGVAHAKFSPGTRTAVVAAPGGVLTQSAIESPAFRDTINRALGSQTTFFVPNSTFYNNFFRDAQTIVDPADPINHICECSLKQPLLLIQVTGDATVPNVSTQRLVTAGDLRQVTTLWTLPPDPLTAVGPNEGVWVNFIKGDHGTLFSPAASPEATAEMQAMAVKFAVTANQPGGPYVVITDETVVEVD